MSKEVEWKDGKKVEEVKEEAKPKAKPKAKRKAKQKRKYHTKGIITTEHLEKEFGMKAKVIRRYLRKMDESTKPRGPQRYEWEANSKELKAIRKNLEAIVDTKESNVR